MSQLKQLTALMQSEKQKVINQKKYWIYLFICFLLVLAGGWISINSSSVFQFTMEYYPYTVLSMVSYVLAPLAIIMMASDLITAENTSDEIKVLLTRPVSRQNIMTAKILTVMKYAAAVLLVCGTGALIISVFAREVFKISMIKVGAAYLVGYLPLITMTSLVCMLANVIKSTSASFIVCIVGYLASFVVGMIYSGISPVLLTSYMGIGRMVIGNTIPFTSLISGIALLAGYTCIFLSVSSLYFDGKEF